MDDDNLEFMLLGLVILLSCKNLICGLLGALLLIILSETTENAYKITGAIKVYDILILKVIQSI